LFANSACAIGSVRIFQRFQLQRRIAQTHLSGWDPATTRELVWEGGDWLLYAFLTPAVFAISQRLPLVRPHLMRRGLLHLGISLLFCVIWAASGKVLHWALMLLFEPNTVRTAVQASQFLLQAGVDALSWLFITLPFGVAVYLCVVGAEHAIRYFIEARERDVQVARLSEQLSGAFRRLAGAGESALSFQHAQHDCRLRAR
jgi:hypothetical protein